jgi:hypothetical protein
MIFAYAILSSQRRSTFYELPALSSSNLVALCFILGLPKHLNRSCVRRIIPRITNPW